MTGVMSSLNKRDEVERLMKVITKQLTDPSLSNQKLVEYLDQIKQYGRNPNDADAIISRTGVDILSRYAFGDYSSDVAHEASKCIANSLLLKPSLRQIFVDLGLLPKATERLQLITDSSQASTDREALDDEEEFLMCRILFFATYQTNCKLADLEHSYELGDSLRRLLQRRLGLIKASGRFPTTQSMAGMALKETLQLLLSVTSAAPELVSPLSRVKACLVDLLEVCPTSNPPLQPLFSSLLNALANLDFANLLSDFNSGIHEGENERSFEPVIKKLVAQLDLSIQVYKVTELEVPAIPLFTVLRKLYPVTSQQDKICMQQLLLPSQINRDKPIGQGDDLPSRLLRLTTTSASMNLSESVSGLMFELSDKDASTYVANVGFGFAAGYLTRHGIPVPQTRNASKTDAQNQEVPINPITGQRLDREPADNSTPMTMEEKEREAERLFVLFERLKATGVVDVENPLKRAMQEGKLEQSSRIEELSDSD